MLKRDLLISVMPLMNTAAASGAETAQTHPQILAFQLFGQGVAYFQAAQTLIAAHRAIEALPLLRGLVTIAARFEQMTAEHGPGLGLMIRLALDWLSDEIFQSASERADDARSGFCKRLPTSSS